MSMVRTGVPAVFLHLMLAIVLYSLLISATGCGANSPAQKPDSGILLDAGMRECAVYDEGKPRACTCSSGAVGTQACLAGRYQPCKCETAVSPSDQPLCKAGFYSGNFTGKYKPGVFGFGFIEGPLEFDLQGQGVGNYPALSFTLLEEGKGDSEFSTYTVKDGCMIGSAAVKSTYSPFVGRIQGELNCKTGVFDGTISGRYDLVGLNLLKYDFSGTATAQFQLPVHLVDGLWNVKEPDALLGTPSGGGGGTWSADWVSDTPPAGDDPCTSADMWSDAGTDAGGPEADDGGGAEADDGGGADAGP
jgi:hypothetical protein